MELNSVIEEIKPVVTGKWGDEVVGIVLYGSFVRGKDYRDIDVLIVLEKLNKTRLERIKDITEIKRELGFPVDIMLISKEECVDNFKSHNPIFLDIAFEGEIIYDNDLLKKLIDEIKLETRRRRIRKEFSRWIFPVKERVSTTLSEITNKDWANYWLKDSKRDLKAANSLLREKLYERTVYHCQQCVEKTVKAILICFGIYEKTHYVASILRREVEKKDLKEKGYADKLNEIIKIAEELEPHVSLSRYPGVSHGKVWLPSKEYNRKIAENVLKDAKKTVKIGKDFVKWWFKGK